jgi:hypothetical protein
MSFYKKLFGGGGSDTPAAPRVLGEQEHKGFIVRAIEMKIGGEYQLSGEILKTIGDEMKSHRFIRADRLSSEEQATSVSLTKGVQIIDEQGDRLFS